MGVYQYTLRAPTKTVSGIVIGQFKFAYKCGWDSHNSRLAKLLSAKADDAACKLNHRKVTHFVQGDWYDGQPIYHAPEAFAEFTEELRTTPIVGWLVKDERGRWNTVMKSSADLLAAHPEVGVLQTEDGMRYYVDGLSSKRHANLLDALPDALLKRVSLR